MAVDVVGAAAELARKSRRGRSRVAPVDTTVTRAVTRSDISHAGHTGSALERGAARPADHTHHRACHDGGSGSHDCSSAAAAPTTAAPTTAPPTTAAPHIPPSLYIGDSVTLGASPSLVASLGPQVGVDAVVSRQYSALPELVASYRDRNAIPGQVVIHLGTNGFVEPRSSTRPWPCSSTAQRVDLRQRACAQAVAGLGECRPGRHSAEVPNAVVVDWFGHSNGHPEWFVSDGVHLNREGIAAYVSLVGTAMLM